MAFSWEDLHMNGPLESHSENAPVQGLPEIFEILTFSLTLSPASAENVSSSLTLLDCEVFGWQLLLLRIMVHRVNLHSD